jgi:hypothetical protein
MLIPDKMRKKKSYIDTKQIQEHIQNGKVLGIANLAFNLFNHGTPGSLTGPTKLRIKALKR